MDNGAVDSAEAVEKHVKDKKIPFIVVHDDKAMTTRKYGVRMSPMAYLIGADGTVIWNGHPHAGMKDQLEKIIGKAIEDAKKMPKPDASEDGADEPEETDEE